MDEIKVIAEKMKCMNLAQELMAEMSEIIEGIEEI